MRITRHTRLQLILHKVTFYLLFLGIIGMLGWLSLHYQWQSDLTANKRHSLSEQSVALLERLPGEITVHAYTRDEITAKAISEIIARYQRHKDEFNLRLLNPDIDLADVQRDGIVMNKPFAFIIYYGQRMEHINSLSEQSISNALLRLGRASEQRVVFIHGHGERSVRDADAADERNYSKLQRQLSDMGFNIDSVNLLTEGLPQNTRLLVIAAPQSDYLAGELGVIREHLEAGGNLLWLVEPGSLHGLESLATSFGIQLHDGAVIDNNSELRRSLNILHPSMIPVTEYFSHEITDTIRYNTLFPSARGISPLSQDAIVDNWVPTALFNSLARSWSEGSGLDNEQVSFSSEDGDIAGPITLAVAMQRAVADDPAQGQQRVVIIGDSDFASDRFIGAGANLNLALNIFNWLVGDDDYISIETRRPADTRLEFDDRSLFVIAVGFFFVIPLGLAVTGFLLRYRRSRR